MRSSCPEFEPSGLPFQLVVWRGRGWSRAWQTDRHVLTGWVALGESLDQLAPHLGWCWCLS